MLAGWSSGSKYPLLGSIRASAQMISYEAAMGLTIAMVVIVTHSLSTPDDRGLPGSELLSLEHLPPRNTALPAVRVAVTAELNRPPFDLTEGSRSSWAGSNTEYSSLRFALFYLAEFMNTITMSAVMVTLFFGGPDGPGFHFVRWLWPDPVVRRQDRRVHVRLRLDTRGPAPAALRPAHGARLEGPDPALTRMAPGSGCLPGRNGLGTWGLLRWRDRGQCALAGRTRRACSSRGARGVQGRAAGSE